MLKIGDFSKICQVSIRALRHWDSIGLLKPALTDADSGYRYYTIAQMDDVNRILALRAMNLSLEQITTLLHDNPTPSDIRAMLRLKQAELQAQIQDAAAVLKMVESRLDQIDRHGEPMPQHEVMLKAAPSLPMLAIRERVPDMTALVNLLHETYPYARQKDNCHLFAVFHDDAYDEHEIDVEVGFSAEISGAKPIPLARGREMTIREFPAVEMLATTVHRGDWRLLPRAYMEVGRWITANGYVIDGAGREIFHHIDWENAQQSTVTEVQIPVRIEPLSDR